MCIIIPEMRNMLRVHVCVCVSRETYLWLHLWDVIVLQLLND